MAVKKTKPVRNAGAMATDSEQTKGLYYTSLVLITIAVGLMAVDMYGLFVLEGPEQKTFLGVGTSVLVTLTFSMVLIGMVCWYIHASRQSDKIQNISTDAEFRAKRDQDAILRLMDELADLSNGDLTIEAMVTEDFTGAIADSVNYAIESMRELVGTINRTSTQVSEASNSTREIAEQMQKSSTEQAEKIHNITDIIASMVQSLDKVSNQTTESAEIAHNSVTIAQEGGKQVRNTINGMNQIRENIQETSKRIKRLGESSQEIGNIVELIKGIADQTNILALNAAIQATSAGEAGRGFAVVADEVKRLADRSSNATKRIESLVKTIQTDTNEAVASMERSTAEVVNGAVIAEEAGKALNRIEEVSTSLAGLIEKVSDSAKNVSTMADDIARDMNGINQMAARTTENVIKTSDAIENLSQLSKELKNSVSGFKLPEGY